MTMCVNKGVRPHNGERLINKMISVCNEPIILDEGAVISRVVKNKMLIPSKKRIYRGFKLSDFATPGEYQKAIQWEYMLDEKDALRNKLYNDNGLSRTIFSHECGEGDIL